jgi:hypothetical protein
VKTVTNAGVVTWGSLLLLAAGAGCKGGGGGASDGGSGGSAGHAAGGAAGTQGGASGGTTGGAGRAGNGGSVGSGGAGVADGSVDRQCGAAAPVTFVREKIRSLAAGRFSAGLVIGTDGTPTFLYLDGNAEAQQIWATQLPTVDDAGISVTTGYQISRTRTGGDVEQVPAIRVAKDGEIRAAYQEAYNGGLFVRYLTWSGDFTATPSDTIVGSDGPNLTEIRQLGFDLDANDDPAIAYLRNDYAIRYATNSGSSWQIETVTSQFVADLALGFNGASSPALFVPETGTAAQTSDLYVTSRGTAGWSSPVLLDPANTQGNDPWVGRDSSGQLEAFYPGQFGQQRRAVGGPGAWDVSASLPTLPALSDGAIPAVAFGTAGQIHVVYGASGLGVLYAYFDGCTWSTAVVDSDVTQGGYAAIALDATGQPQIAYGPAVSSGGTAPAGTLWYAHPSP